MNKPLISIVMPAIRKERWAKFYDSVLDSTSRSFELIIVGPYAPDGKLENVSNIKFVKDYGSPTRCANIGLLLCEGPIFFGMMADDAVLQKGVLDRAIDAFLAMPKNIKNIISCKSVEGVDGTEKTIQGLEYYTVNHSPVTASKYIPDDWLIMNGAICHTQYIQYLGGLDCSFQGAAMASTDLAIRAQIDGAKMKFYDEVLFDLNHMPGTSGDHAPIHYSQILEDEPMYRVKYSNPLEIIKTKIDIMNWMKADTVWARRFGAEG